MRPEEPQEEQAPSTERQPGYRIDRSMPCLSCEYDLMGLPIEGRCPECGSPVEDSLQKHLPGLEQEKVLEQFRRGLNVNAAAWMVLALLSVGCLGFPFLMLMTRPVILFMAFTSMARALSIGLLQANRSIIPGELPVPVWLLVTLPATGALVALIQAIGLAPVHVLLAVFMLLSVLEGLTWLEFIRRTAQRLECSINAKVVQLGFISWAVVLLGVPIMVIMAVKIMMAVNGSSTDLLMVFLLIPVLAAWFTSLVMTSLLTRALADALPKLGLAKPLEDLTTEPDPVEMPARVVKPGDDTPLPLADSTGTTIEVRNIDGLRPPDAGKRKPD